MTSLSIKRKFEWIITNVTKNKLMKPGFRASTENIHLILGDNKTEWAASIVTSETDGIKYLAIWLYKKNVDENNFDVKVYYKLGNVRRILTITSALFRINMGRGFSTFITIDQLFDKSYNYVDQNGCLKIYMEIELSMAIPKPLCPSINMPSYSHYITDPKFSDFTLQSSDNAELQVHRLVLAESSPFFRTLFTVDMQERQSEKVIFDDINEMTLKKVLKFAYTGSAVIVDVNEATDVLYAAEKFFMTDLKQLCFNKLINEISIENVLEILVTADMYKDEELEKKCLEFILSNYNELRSSREWSELKFPLLLKITDAFAILQAGNEAQKITLMTKLKKGY